MRILPNPCGPRADTFPGCALLPAAGAFWGLAMIALVFATANGCTVVILDSLPACVFLAMQVAHMGRAFCIPAGVAV